MPSAAIAAASSTTQSSVLRMLRAPPGSGYSDCGARSRTRATSCPGTYPTASGEEVLVARAQQRGGARAVLGGDMPLESAHHDRRLARVLVAHEVGGGRRLVGDGDPRRAQLAPRAVAPAAPVLERPQAGDPDRDLGLAVAPRPAERVGDHDGGARGQRGPERAGARVGVAGEEDERVGRRRVRGVDAGVRADEAVARAGDDDAAFGADDVAGLVEHDLDVAGTLVEPLREHLRARRRSYVGERDDRALGLRDDLVGHDENVGRLELLARRGGEQRREIVAGPYLRETLERPRLEAAHRRPRRISSPRVWAAPPVRASSAARRAARSSSVSTSRASDGGSAIRHSAPASRASCSWRLRLPSPKLGPIASGGQRTSAFVPVPWRSGTIVTRASLCGWASSRSSTSVGSSAGQSPGTSSARRAPCSIAQRTPARAAGLWPVSSGSRIVCALCARASASAVCSRVTTTTASTRLDRRRAVSTSMSIASASARRLPGRSTSPSRSLASSKRLTGRTAIVLTATDPPRSPASPRQRAGGRRRRP